LFPKGLEVDYAGQFLGSPNFEPGAILVRCILLLWTGDYLAQSEVGKFIQGGIFPCRRDKLKGTPYHHSFLSYHTNFKVLQIHRQENNINSIKPVQCISSSVLTRVCSMEEI